MRRTPTRFPSFADLIGESNNNEKSKKMKKTIAIAALLAATAGAGAQNMYDAITFSQNQYFGSARSMAMGNAVTAVGGDLGTVVINPAGSAVAGYGQFIVTPGFTISAVNSSWSPEGENAYGLASGLTQTRMNLPSLGFTFNFSTGKRTGLKWFTFGVMSTQTNNYNFASDAFGNNSRTSKIAEFADAAYGYNESLLASASSFNNSAVPWDVLTAYQGGMYGPYGWDGIYAGVTETISDDGSYHYVPGSLAQTSSRTKTGSKNDLVVNFAMNFSDRVYVGFNVGLPTARYRYDETFNESAVDPGQFPIIYEDGGKNYTTYFMRGNYNYQYLADMAGIYAKIGLIVRPFDGLRLGATFQTPTAFTVNERWQHFASSTFDDNYYNDSQNSPEGEYQYVLRTPYRASFGAAYTLGKMGVVSVDYELADYSVMRFSELRRGRMDSEQFASQNWTNKYFAGVAHSLRIGAEIKPTPAFAIRAGYSMSTSPERYWTDSEGQTVDAGAFEDDFYSYYNRIKNLVRPHYYGDRTRTFSFGVGYSSGGSFFMDAVARLTRYPGSTFAPYYDYDCYDQAGNLLAVSAPRVYDQRNLWNVAVTFGWRF